MDQILKALYGEQQQSRAQNPFLMGRQVVDNMQYLPTTREQGTGAMDWKRRAMFALSQGIAQGMLGGLGERRQQQQDAELGNRFVSALQSADPAGAFAQDPAFARYAPLLALEQYQGRQAADTAVQKAKLELLSKFAEKGFDKENALEIEREKSKLKREEESPQKAFDKAKGLRSEFLGRPEVGAFSTVDTSFQSLLKSANDPTAASDLDFVFGVMKMLDPDSVVREGEQKQAIKTQAIDDTVWGFYQRAKGKQGIGPEGRQALLRLAANRYDANKEKFDQMSGFYRQLAEAQGIDFGTINPYANRLGGQAQLEQLFGAQPQQPMVQQPAPGAGAGALPPPKPGFRRALINGQVQYVPIGAPRG